ncbi:hypothetical protein [Halorubrum aethiopicum]|uniref:hypothetical protein n=1 Tax=Halorubrum aethiopicum TaxID=1758255 RepID=UPI000AB0F91F|nr:hypothetical protein [Halorubrum aethiopicum]
MTDSPNTASTDQANTVELSDLAAIQEGDRIAVRAVHKTTATVLVGTVASKLFEEPDPQEPHPQSATADDSESSPGGTYLSLNYATIWEIDDGDPVDVTSDITDRPPYRLHAQGQLRDPPTPALQYCSDDRFELLIPEPMSNGSYINAYYPASVGTVTDVVFGETIWPEEVPQTPPSSPR